MAQIIGLFRIGRDAEVRYTNGGDPIASLSLASDYYDKNAERNRATQWIDAVLFGKRAESLAQYLTKGSQVFATINDPHVEEYQKKDGTTGVKLVGKIADIEFAGGKNEQQEKPQQAAAKPQGNTPHGKAKANAYQADESDDIPF